MGVAVICALLIGLGIWQLQRAEEKQAWFDSYRARINEPPIQITTRLLGSDRSNFAAEVRGRFDGERASFCGITGPIRVSPDFM